AERDAQVEADDVAEVGHELLGEAAVEAVGAPQLLYLRGADALGALPEEGEHRVAGGEPQHAEHQEHDPEQDGHEAEEALGDVGEHDCLRVWGTPAATPGRGRRAGTEGARRLRGRRARGDAASRVAATPAGWPRAGRG